MNLLPKTKSDFAKGEYWDDFFKRRGAKEFEWYGEYHELCGHLHKYIKTMDNILVVGCGNSKLSSDLYDVGHRKITNIDISSVVIKQVRSSLGRDRPEMKFIQMDVLNMKFSKDEFSVVLDKGTLDALLPSEAKEDLDRAFKMFGEIDKVLKVGGRYILISLLQEHILRAVLDYFTDAGWLIRIERCNEVEKRAALESGKPGMPVFLVICAKLTKLSNSKPLLELNVYQNEKKQSVGTKEDMYKIISGIQKTSAICWMSGADALEFCRDGEENPRYSIYVVDGSNDPKQLEKYAAFIVPQGRETEWLFGSSDGRIYLQQSSGFDRLAVVTLHRNQTYASMNDIQDELRSTILQFAPHFLSTRNEGPQIPYLTLGDGVGHRKTIYNCKSQYSGDIVVEEVDVEGDIFRRLVFLSNQAVVQSEVKLKRDEKGNLIVDKNFVASSHINYMSIGAAILDRNKTISVAVIGLGGGSLCEMIRDMFSKASVTGVDIDPTIFDIAQKFFGLKTDSRLQVVIDDGVHFISEKQPFNVIMLDADSKTEGVAVSCPPAAFIESNILESVKDTIGISGVLVVNVVCRIESAKQEIISRLKEYFSHVCSYSLKEDVNQVVFASNFKDLSASQWCEKVKEAATWLKKKTKQKLKDKKNLIDLEHFKKELKAS